LEQAKSIEAAKRT